MPSFDIDNQQPYWNRVANVKTFTHPLDLDVLGRYCNADARILDYGCGYGRLVTMLKAAGYRDVVGYDTSRNIVRRGQEAGEPSVFFIDGPSELPVADNSCDGILLFAVLTCIPSNDGQRSLVERLRAKLKPGGILLVSDYYLQPDRLANHGYRCLNDDPLNDGVFTLAEGATFRHHSPEWIATLFAGMETVHHAEVPVQTMNGHVAMAFQMVAKKPF